MQIELTEAGGANDTGYYRPQVRNDTLLLEASKLLGSAWHGTTLRARADLQEAMAASDFRNAAFEVLDRETLERYQALPAVWSGYAKRVLNKDFKPKKLVDLLGGMGALPHVPELTEYPEDSVSKALYELSVTKRGKRFAFSWESWINDDLEELESLPEALSIAARETESREGATLLTDGDGPNAAFFNATAIGGATSNLMAGNPELTLASLTAALGVIKARKDPQGRPIALPRLTLVVPTALEVQARTILNASAIRTQEGTGAGSRLIDSNNWVNGAVDLVVEPWLDVLDTGANAAKTWYIVPTPSSGRFALAMGFLRGHEDPQVRIKGNQGQAVGGGALDGRDGSFEIDDIQYRVRHVIGSSYGDPIGSLASTGAGA